MTVEVLAHTPSMTAHNRGFVQKSCFENASNVLEFEYTHNYVIFNILNETILFSYLFVVFLRLTKPDKHLIIYDHLVK